MNYIHRTIESTLQRYLQSFPIVGITGPRQSGKTTLLQNQLRDYQYVTFDDPKMIDFLENDPQSFITRYQNKVIFDEVHKAPEIFNYLKIAVDNDRQNYGKFILTASSQFSFLQKITESLAGRIGLLALLPLQYIEIPPVLTDQSVYKGGYPELVVRSYRDDDLWFSAYLDTYLTKDLRALSNIGDLGDFRRLINLLAAHTTQVLDYTHYASDLGVSATTVKRWISVLEASYIIFLLPSFSKNLKQRVVKRPKIYFYDVGLVSYLTGIKDATIFNQGPMAGAIFENYIIAEIFKKELHQKTNAELFFLRTSNQVEIDLIIDRKQFKELIEIKKNSSFKSAMVKTLRQFTEEKDQAYLLYTGDFFQYANNITAMNYQRYLQK